MIGTLTKGFGSVFNTFSEALVRPTIEATGGQRLKPTSEARAGDRRDRQYDDQHGQDQEDHGRHRGHLIPQVVVFPSKVTHKGCTVCYCLKSPAKLVLSCVSLSTAKVLHI